ncbi:39S ribosomal protein L46, mitochondrial [Frankliniella fusca]|uniref:Large ribosomal subunit protein mL46 n=1 Tax=Frankliniella fusca TaxID=407009 RepID=A0AAE1HE96_9NEOP|nr:39S ribosomal protein L46, mitochondrial [Frankliniella fusca]
MLRRVSSKVYNLHSRPKSTSAAAREKWNLVSSVCLQRKPVLMKEMTEFEKQVQNLLHQIEEEKSWKNDWELAAEKDLQEMEQIKGGDATKVGRKLRRDWEDEWKAELKAFKVQPCITKADQKNDIKSWDRLLDSTLFLVIQQTESGNRWVLPHGQHAEGETMRETAERVLKESCGELLSAKFYSNAPCGFFKYKYPKAIREKLGIEGDKVFFYKAYLTGGELKPSSILKDFKWIPRKDLKTTLPPEYCRSVEMFLIDED